MGKIEMDVNKIKAAGSSIKGIAKEYNDVIETVFQRYKTYLILGFGQEIK